MIVLGLDLGQTGGFSRYDTVSGDLRTGRFQFGKLEEPERIIAFGRWFEAVLGGTLVDFDGQVLASGLDPVDVVGYELVTFGQGRADFIKMQEGLVQYLGRQVAWQGVNVQTVKKFGLGLKAPPPLRYRGMTKQEKNRARSERRKLVAGLLQDAAREWFRKLGSEPPEKLSADEAVATLVMTWMLVNRIPGWSLEQ